MKIHWKPQILWGMTLIAIVAALVIFFAPTYVEGAAGGAITGIGMLGMKLLENE